MRQAAQELGVTVDAIRSRVRRGSIEHEKAEDGRVFVWVDTNQGGDQGTDNTQSQVEGSGLAPLVEELRRQNEYLREQLDAEREARTEERRRSDTLIARLMDRLPELEAPAEPQGEAQDAPRTSYEEAGRADIPPQPTSTTEGDSAPLWHSADVAPEEEPPRRFWWQRWFGGQD